MGGGSNGPSAAAAVLDDFLSSGSVIGTMA
jgi:hypothetical protein